MVQEVEANPSALVNYSAHYRRGEPISTAFVENVINEIVSKRMIKKQLEQMDRPAFPRVRVAVLDGTLERLFRKLYPNFQSANDSDAISAAA